MATTKKPTKEKLAEYAESIRSELKEFRQQDDLFRLAVEVGYLAARADGEVDDSERKTLVDAVDILSKGVIIEMEVDSIIAEVEAVEGDDVAKAKVLGEQLAKLEQADAGLLVGAFVAQSTSGIDKNERKVLRDVGRAGGLKDARIRAILKTVGAEAPDDDS
jgi:tellurite resistance protein